jgi:hypothetical protein
MFDDTMGLIYLGDGPAFKSVVLGVREYDRGVCDVPRGDSLLLSNQPWARRTEHDWLAGATHDIPAANIR